MEQSCLTCTHCTVVPNIPASTNNVPKISVKDSLILCKEGYTVTDIFAQNECKKWKPID